MNNTNFEIKVRDGLSLKLRHLEDAEAFFQLVDSNRNYFRPWLDWVDFTVSTDDTRIFIQKCLDGFEKKVSADLGVMYEGQWVGSMGFHTIELENGWAEIGYWLSKDHTGKGIMTDCVKAMIDYGFKTLNLHRIQIKCDSANVASKAIPERLGFNLDGTIREDRKHNGQYSSTLVYGLLESEWPIKQ